MSVIGSNIIAGASGAVETGYQIARSLRFNSADTAHLTRTPAGAGDTLKWTLSAWVKRSTTGAAGTVGEAKIFGAASSSSNVAYLMFSDNTADALTFAYYNGSSHVFRLTTSAVYRDLSAWYHIVLAYDSAQATDTNRVKLYVNGTQVTVFGTAVYPSQNYATFINGTNTHYLGQTSGGGVGFFNGYITDVNFIGGQALAPSDFGQTDSATGVWIPKAYTGTYGTNGFWLKFDDNSNTTAATLGKDSSGNGNNWTPNNFSVTAGVDNDSLVDSPTSYGTDTGVGGEVRGNYCTWNPINPTYNTTHVTLSNGNLQVTKASSTIDWRLLPTFVLPASGKWYWEVTITAVSFGDGFMYVGIADTQFGSSGFGTFFTNGYFYTQSGGKATSASGGGSAYGATYSVNDVIAVAYDADAGTITFYKNGTSQGTAFSSISTATNWFPALSQSGNPSSSTTHWNFGQRPFAYTAPSGFRALCTTNLPTPAVGASASTLANKYFDILTYTGNGATRTLSGLGFQPDVTWIKARSVAYDHRLWDAVRGTGTKGLQPSLNVAEGGGDAFGYINAFTSDGFTVISGSSSIAGVNDNTQTFVAWNWKANGAGSSNTAGSITSTVSANQTAGISIVGWTGTGANATIGHGLGVAPRLIIIKSRSAGSTNWNSYHASIGAGSTIVLNLTIAATAGSQFFNNTAPTSTVFSVGTDGSINPSGQTQIAYCFAEVTGFSRFGSYVGNGNADGPFIYCGFRPRWIVYKASSGASDWVVLDTSRDDFNVADSYLLPNSAAAEATSAIYDIVSNGFKCRSATFANTSSVTYIFAAFAETPFNYARAR